MEIPKVGSRWRHKSGAVYEVIMIANEKSTSHYIYPITVVYQADGNIWSRPLANWNLTPLAIPHVTLDDFEFALQKENQAELNQLIAVRHFASQLQTCLEEFQDVTACAECGDALADALHASRFIKPELTEYFSEAEESDFIRDNIPPT